MMNWWLDRGVDGFRMDVINFISKDTALPDGPIAAGKLYGDGTPFYIGGPRIHEFLQEMHREVFAGPHRPAAHRRRNARRHRGRGHPVHRPRAGRGGHGVPVRARGPGPGGRQQVAAQEAQAHRAQADPGPLAGRAWRSAAGTASTGATTTRPAPCPASATTATYRELSAKMLAGILHLHRGTPYVYQGEELGMTNMTFGAISDYRDIEVLNHHREATTHLGHTDAEVLAALAPLNRDNARTPVQWDASRHAGFTTGSPWIAVNPNANHINAAAQVDDPDSVYSFYRKVIALRHAEPVVSHGDFTMLLPRDEHVYAFTRASGRFALPESRDVTDGAGSGAAGAGQLLRRGPDVDARRRRRAAAWGSAELVLGNYPSDAAPRRRLCRFSAGACERPFRGRGAPAALGTAGLAPAPRRRSTIRNASPRKEAWHDHSTAARTRSVSAGTRAHHAGARSPGTRSRRNPVRSRRRRFRGRAGTRPRAHAVTGAGAVPDAARSAADSGSRPGAAAAGPDPVLAGVTVSGRVRAGTGVPRR